MYYPKEYLWFRIKRRWTFAEDARIVRLRLMTYDRDFNWDGLRNYDHQLWKRKTIKTTYRRFLGLLNDYECCFVRMPERDQMEFDWPFRYCFNFYKSLSENKRQENQEEDESKDLKKTPVSGKTMRLNFEAKLNEPMNTTRYTIELENDNIKV
ncbi:hypothetical protein KQX54_000414 [Cotesia glomerata]|uniref:Uncharacterized protein n=1 Tax=Cotesia glomerata TaxID=32391 RepID=A0AAV7HVM6_COTGL|nr:hypothetical protein KQX54_000414 [Cotesia glomerata]